MLCQLSYRGSLSGGHCSDRLRAIKASTVTGTSTSCWGVPSAADGANAVTTTAPGEVVNVAVKVPAARRALRRGHRLLREHLAVADELHDERRLEHARGAGDLERRLDVSAGHGGLDEDRRHVSGEVVAGQARPARDVHPLHGGKLRERVDDLGDLVLRRLGELDRRGAVRDRDRGGDPQHAEGRPGHGRRRRHPLRASGGAAPGRPGTP